MGGVDKVKRQHDQGRLTVRERIDKLIDKNSFHEIGAISGIAEYDEINELKHLTPANCVFGRGRIDGRTVVVVGDDFTVRGGSADASISAKPLMAEEMAHEGGSLRLAGVDADTARLLQRSGSPLPWTAEEAAPGVSVRKCIAEGAGVRS